MDEETQSGSALPGQDAYFKLLGHKHRWFGLAVAIVIGLFLMAHYHPTGFEMAVTALFGNGALSWQPVLNGILIVMLGVVGRAELNTLRQEQQLARQEREVTRKESRLTSDAIADLCVELAVYDKPAALARAEKLRDDLAVVREDFLRTRRAKVTTRRLTPARRTADTDAGVEHG